MTWPTYDTIKTELSDRILTVTLDRPNVLNALDSQMGLDLVDAWSRIAAAGDDVRVVILTGAGARAFCAGGDFKERNGLSDAAWQHQHEIFERALLGDHGFTRPRSSPPPTAMPMAAGWR